MMKMKNKVSILLQIPYKKMRMTMVNLNAQMMILVILQKQPVKAVHLIMGMY